MRIAFYVSGNATIFSKVMKECNEHILKTIKVVFSEDKSTNYLVDDLKAYDIAYHFCDYNSLNGNKNLEMSDNLLKVLNDNSIDYMFSTGRHILKGELLKKYKFRMINFHPSILPQYPGGRKLKSIDWAISENVSVLGNTAHFIDEGVDTGPIIMQNVMSRKCFDEYGYYGIMNSQVELFKRVYRLLDEDRIHVDDDGNVHIDSASYDNIMYIPQIEWTDSDDSKSLQAINRPLSQKHRGGGKYSEEVIVA